MILKEFPCTCSTATEYFSCKENCDKTTQLQWVLEKPSKWIVYREFESENEANDMVTALSVYMGERTFQIKKD